MSELTFILMCPVMRIAPIFFAACLCAASFGCAGAEPQDHEHVSDSKSALSLSMADAIHQELFRRCRRHGVHLKYEGALASPNFWGLESANRSGVWSVCTAPSDAQTAKVQNLQEVLFAFTIGPYDANKSNGRIHIGSEDLGVTLLPMNRGADTSTKIAELGMSVNEFLAEILRDPIEARDPSR